MDRILSNPDNLIVSESLIGRIDFDGEPIPEISTKFTWGPGQSTAGRFRRYKINSDNEPEEEVKVSFASQEDQLEKLLGIKMTSKCQLEILNTEIEGALTGISISTQSAELIITVTINRYI
jgi:hypothetical protein